jgi:hypothetical protein
MPAAARRASLLFSLPLEHVPADALRRWRDAGLLASLDAGVDGVPDDVDFLTARKLKSKPLPPAERTLLIAAAPGDVFAPELMSVLLASRAAGSPVGGVRAICPAAALLARAAMHVGAGEPTIRLWLGCSGIVAAGDRVTFLREEALVAAHGVAPLWPAVTFAAAGGGGGGFGPALPRFAATSVCAAKLVTAATGLGNAAHLHYASVCVGESGRLSRIGGGVGVGFAATSVCFNPACNAGISMSAVSVRWTSPLDTTDSAITVCMTGSCLCCKKAHPTCGRFTEVWWSYALPWLAAEARAGKDLRGYDAATGKLQGAQRKVPRGST